MFCRCFQKRNNISKHYYKAKLYLIEKLSVENILKSLINLDLFKKIVLDESQYILFKSIPKQNLKKLRSLEKYNINESNIFQNMDNTAFENDNIRNRILEYF